MTTAFHVSLNKKHAKYFTQALLMAGVIWPGSVGRIVESGAEWHFELPNTDLTVAVWYGFIAGKKIGYFLGADLPSVSTQIWPTQQTPDK